MTVDPIWVEQHIRHELGLTTDDLCRLYGVAAEALPAQLAALGATSREALERVLSDVDAVRVGYRQLQISDDHIAQLQRLLSAYPFHPLVSLPLWDGGVGWRLSADDAQYVAFRAADIVGLDFAASDVLRRRLNTLVIGAAEQPPAFDAAFQRRVVDITCYLLELSGVL
ncbi:MAG: hypothetical protein ACK4P1_01580 [Aggregatilineales bacterium]